MPIKTNAYRCEWCQKKILLTKQAMIHHEENCFWNPQRKACRTCGNFTKASNDFFYIDGAEGSTGTPWCDGYNYNMIDHKLKFNCEKWKPKGE